MALWSYGGAVQHSMLRVQLRTALLPPRGGPAVRHLSHASQRTLRESYRLLQLQDPPYSQAQVKEAYLRLAKLYHPDSGTPTASAALFAQIQEAYRAVLAHHARREAESRRREEDEEEDEEPKGRAPQHRQYLSYEGEGSGTPSQRERAYRQRRVDRAAEQVLEYRRREMERAAAADEGAVSERRDRRRHTKITQAVERLVEDLIQESMARGDFRNLSGAGKPLAKFAHNPYADPATHNLNRILIDNGYQPQWIVAQREIREAVGKLRAELAARRAGFADPVTPAERDRWEEHCRAAGERLTAINRKVDDFNLIVPLLSKQMVHFSLRRELERAARADRERRLEREREKEEREREEREREEREEKTAAAGGRGIFSWVQTLLKWPV